MHQDPIVQKKTLSQQNKFPVELHRLKEVAPRMRPAPGMYHLAPDFAVASVTVGLQDAFKFSQELPGTLSATIKLEVEHDRSQWPAVLP
jgi:hypothetical protein